MNRFAATIIVCLAAASVAGCISSPTRFYTLSSTPVQSAVQQTNYSVSVGPVSVPAVVDRPQIVVRTDPNQVAISEFDRWASPLKEDIARVIARNLIVLLGTMQITTFPQSTAADKSYRCVIDILSFDSELGKAASLDALWRVTSAKDGQVYQGRTTLTEPAQGGDFTAIAAAHSRTLGQLSADIAGTIKKMESEK
jgi:uncharacterized protein